MSKLSTTNTHGCSDHVDCSLLHDVITGLRKSPKEISPVWFYDEVGSKLFDAICELPEYYLTRAELNIMVAHAKEMAQYIGPNATIIEFGSGTSLKTRLLLDQLESPAAYIPVDIACKHLKDAAQSLARDYPSLPVIPVCANFTLPLDLPAKAYASAKRVVYFPGSTLGNFEPAAARQLLKGIHNLIGPQGALLIGIDLKKDIHILERAYDDPTGLTAEFNLNALRHINRKLGSDFKPEAFEHRAVWQELAGRIEMHLVSKYKQVVYMGGEHIAIEQGEYLLTERSHKYTLESFASLAFEAKFEVRRVWSIENLFSVQLLQPKQQ